MKGFKGQPLKVKQMITFRLLAVFIALYIFYLYSFRLGVGMIPVWSFLLVVSMALSFQKIYSFVFTHKILKFSMLAGIVFVILIELFIIYSGYKTSINEDSDYIIVLGASVKGETPSLTLRRRIEKASDYLEIHPEAKAILSGGQGPGEAITEAEAMKRALIKSGINEHRLILEEQSTSTMENIKYSFDIIQNDLGETEAKVIVISSRFHLLRSQIIARKQGYRVKAVGSTTLIYLVPNYYLREFFGIFYELLR